MIPLLLGLALGSPTGSEIAAELEGLDGRERQARLVEHLLEGHTPGYLGSMVPVRWQAKDVAGVQHAIEILVQRDYTAVGTDADFLRAPLDLISAVSVGRTWGLALPTSKIVDEVHAEATEKLIPRPMAPNDRMRSVWAYLRYRARLQEQGATRPTEGLRAGHKKDLVLTPKLDEQPDRVAIYGWHRRNGEPIQPVSLWHGAGYTDYSHGVRFVHPVVQVDGQPRDLFEVLADPVLWPLVSDEGPWAAAKSVMWPDQAPVYPPLEESAPH